MAAIARKVYLNKNSGVGQLAKVSRHLCPWSCYHFMSPEPNPVQAFGSNERRGAKVTFRNLTFHYCMI